MKVSSKMPSSVQNAETAKAGKAGGAEALFEAKKARGAAGAADISGGSARVDVSTRAQDMARAKELATPSDDIDEAKVERLQRLIDSGQYKIDAEAIADRLIDEHSKMP
jgi:negative regulator of flagellin synthesis FlgM